MDAPGADAEAQRAEEQRAEEQRVARRKELFDQLSAQARVDQQASSDSFDNQLLTFSSALLGLSVAFIKDIVPLKIALWLPLLYTSWGLLGLCILATLLGFRFGVEAQKKQQDFLYEYYIQKIEASLNKKSGWTKGAIVCGYIGGVTFFVAVVLTILFAIRNVSYARTHDQQGQSATLKNGLASATTDGEAGRSTQAGLNGAAQGRGESASACEDDSCRPTCGFACCRSTCKSCRIIYSEEHHRARKKVISPSCPR